MTSRYRGENAVPFSPKGMGIAPIIELSVVNEISLIADPPPFSWFWIKRIALNHPQCPSPTKEFPPKHHLLHHAQLVQDHSGASDTKAG